MKYITTERQAADIFTKHFTDRLKWYQSLLLINHYPNFRASLAPEVWAQADPDIQDDDIYDRMKKAPPGKHKKRSSSRPK